MKPHAILSRSAVSLALLGAALPSAAATVDVTLTADNAYALYTGTYANISAYHGFAENPSASDIASPETYTFTMSSGDSIYVVAYSDDFVAQGLLAEFDVDGTVLTTGSSRWEVAATGIDLDPGDTPPTLAELTAQVQLANAGSVPSGGWVDQDWGRRLHVPEQG